MEQAHGGLSEVFYPAASALPAKNLSFSEFKTPFFHPFRSF
jgi:hypothetical protein